VSVRPRGVLRRLWTNRRGGVAQIFAISVPVLAMVTAGGIDLTSVNADRTRVQDTADTAALAAAKQLSLSDPEGVVQRAHAFTDEKLRPLTERLHYEVSAVPAADGMSITVTISGKRDSFFANLLPPGGWTVHATATASVMGQTPLCVLSTGVNANHDVRLDDSSRITAPGCLVHANASILASKSASISAHTVQASGDAEGNLQPEPQEGAPEIEDPFAELDFAVADRCTLSLPMLLSGLGVSELEPGYYCADIKVMQKQTLKLKPGKYYFRKGAKLELLEDSTLEGENVLLVFDKGSDFKFKDRSAIRLKGRRDRGDPQAGFVLATARGNTSQFEISSSAARELLGTIYLPDAVLMVDGKEKVADQSAWTVVVARGIRMKGGPSLVINANYAGTAVKPPDGVGPRSNDVRLIE
jgi:Flp pilus assembly protein TadG